MHFDLPFADRPVMMGIYSFYKLLIFISFIWNLWYGHINTPAELSIFATVLIKA